MKSLQDYLDEGWIKDMTFPSIDKANIGIIYKSIVIEGIRITRVIKNDKNKQENKE